MSLLGPFLAAAALLVVAGISKIFRSDNTSRALATSFAWWPVRRGKLLVQLGAAAEACLGASVVVLPLRPAAAAIAVSFLGFAAFVLLARRRGGALSTCGCFGEPDTPATRKHVIVNAALAGCCAWVAWSASLNADLIRVLAHEYCHGLLLVLVSLGLAASVYLVLVPLARLEALRAMRV